MSDFYSTQQKKQDFNSTRSIWEWLLEKPEVNQIRHNKHTASVFLNAKGELNIYGVKFDEPQNWSKHVELPKVTVDRAQLEEAMYFAYGTHAMNNKDRKELFNRFCGKLGLL
jgi:hypothetical protein